MATPEENLKRFQEIKKRGLQDQLPSDVRLRFDEADKRGMLGAMPPAQPATTAPAAKSDFGSLVPLDPAYRAKVEEAYASGDVAFGDFLLRQAEAGEKQTPEGFLEQVKQKAGEVGFMAERAAGRVKEAFTGENRQTEATSLYPEIGFVDKSNPVSEKYTDPVALSLKGVLPPQDIKTNAALSAMSLAGTDEERIQMLRSTPSVVNLFKDEKDNVFAIFNNGYIGQVNKPGLSGSDVERMAVQAIPFGAASKLAKGGGVLKQVGTAMGAQTGMELATIPFGGEFNETEIALSGIMEGIGQGLSKSVGYAWGRMADKERKAIKTWRDLEGKIPNQDFQKIKQLKQAEERLDAPKTLAAQYASNTGNRFKEVGDLIEASKKVNDAERIATKLNEQDAFVRKEIKQQVRQIFQGDALEEGTKRVRAASESIFEDLDAARRVQADKSFGNVFKENAMVDMRPVIAKVRRIAASESIPNGEKQAVLNKLSSYFRPQKGVLLTGMRGKGAQELKFEVDNLIKKRGETAVGENAKKALLEIQGDLIKLIDEANPGYIAANRQFAKNTQKIEELEDTIMGIIRDTGETKLARISKLFDEKDIGAVKQVLGTIGDKDQPAVFALYRSWLDDKLGKIDLKSSQNASKDLYSTLFGSPDKQRRIFELAPSKEVKENLMALRDYLDVSRNIRIAPSGGSGSVISDLFEMGRQQEVQGPRAAVYRALQSKWERARKDALTESVLNPRWAEEMKAMRKVPKAELPAAYDKLINTIIKFSQGAAESPMKPNAGIDKMETIPQQ